MPGQSSVGNRVRIASARTASFDSLQSAAPEIGWVTTCRFHPDLSGDTRESVRLRLNAGLRVGTGRTNRYEYPVALNANKCSIAP